MAADLVDFAFGIRVDGLNGGVAAEVVELLGRLLLQTSGGFGEAAGDGLHGGYGSIGNGLEAFARKMALEGLLGLFGSGFHLVVGVGEDRFC